MTELARWFPLFVVVSLVPIIMLTVRLERRISRTPDSAGPAEPVRPTPPGLQQTPWELQAIEDQLAMARHQRGAGVRRYDLTGTVNRLVAAAGFDQPSDELPLAASEAQLGAAIARIEARLELPPLEETDPSAERSRR